MKGTCFISRTFTAALVSFGFSGIVPAPHFPAAAAEVLTGSAEETDVNGMLPNPFERLVKISDVGKNELR